VNLTKEKEAVEVECRELNSTIKDMNNRIGELERILEKNAKQLKSKDRRLKEALNRPDVGDNEFERTIRRQIEASQELIQSSHDKRYQGNNSFLTDLAFHRNELVRQEEGFSQVLVAVVELVEHTRKESRSPSAANVAHLLRQNEKLATDLYSLGQQLHDSQRKLITASLSYDAPSSGNVSSSISYDASKRDFSTPTRRQNHYFAATPGFDSVAKSHREALEQL